ncbi:MAG: histidine kinase [Proteobacteria bacterium]|nr:histidine kinase [Pseudomonadota bacterium]
MLILLGLFVTPFHVINLQRSGNTPEQNRAIKREIDVNFGQSALGIAEEVVKALQRSSKDPARVAELDRAIQEIDRARREIQADLGTGESSRSDAGEARRAAREAALEAAQDSYEAAVEAREAIEESQQEIRRTLQEGKIPVSEWPKSLDKELQAAKKVEEKAKLRVEKTRAKLKDRRVSIAIATDTEQPVVDIKTDELPLPPESATPPEPPGNTLEIAPPAIPLPPPLPNELKQDIRSKVSSDLYRIGVGSIVILLFIPLFMIALIAKYFIGRARRMQELAELKKKEAEFHSFSRQITEAKLQALQAQVEPHFLYNTLANVQALTEVDPAAANTMVGNLIQYLRASLPKMRETGSTVEQEVERVEAFLNILKMRMGERLEFAIDVAEDAKSLSFPPLILPTLVENAIKHGLEPLREGGRIDIVAKVEDGQLVVSVRDNGRGLSTGTDTVGGGVGLSNIRERLAALFGGSATMTLMEHQPRGVVARIAVPISKPVTAALDANGNASPSGPLDTGKNEAIANGVAAKAWSKVKKTHSVWGNIISFTFIALMVLLAVVFGVALAAMLAGAMPVMIGGMQLEGMEGLALGSLGLLVGFTVVTLAIIVVVAVIYGLGVLFAGLLIFIPVVILIAIFPALAPGVLVGLLIYWFVRKKRKHDAPSGNDQRPH